MFKVKDKVYHVGDNTYGDFEEKEIYEISGVDSELNKVKIKGNPLWWNASRFKNIEDFIAKPYVIITSEKDYIVVAENLEEAEIVFKSNSSLKVVAIKEVSSDDIYELA